MENEEIRGIKYVGDTLNYNCLNFFTSKNYSKHVQRYCMKVPKINSSKKNFANDDSNENLGKNT